MFYYFSFSSCFMTGMRSYSFTVEPLFGDAMCTGIFSRQPLAPHIRVWDSVSLNTLHVLGLGFFDRALVCLAFSKSVRKHHRNTQPGNFSHVFSCPLSLFSACMSLCLFLFDRMEETRCVLWMTPMTTSSLSGTGRERTGWLRSRCVKYTHEDIKLRHTF